ncbi:hypothetical protein PIB30_017006 [Stylosanthes scabra]|uniref:RNase H type-1 domain-containing protein n=1 Tax=Stylosanthes scabra TaxID=79078 RepID=A0ABU6Q7B1_9FABA|nr:hypothetical protein [Stylosanthes scabra]
MVWLTLHNALPTNVFRFKRGMTSDDLCKRCGHAPEDVLHYFWSCPKAKAALPKECWSDYTGCYVVDLEESLPGGTTHLIPPLFISKWVPPPMDYYKNGLILAWEAGCQNVMCETDSLEVYQHLHNIFNSSILVDVDLSCKIQDLLRRYWNVQFGLIKREANSAVDWIAKKGALSNSDYCLWTTPGEELAEILCQEAVGPG